MEHMTTNQTENHHVHLANMTGLDYPEREIEAKLAVAYELRTQNMIALYTAGGLWRSAVLRSEFGDAIKERLGAETE